MPTPRGADRLLHLTVGLLGLLFAVRALTLVASPYPSDYGEGTTWTYARLLRSHGTYFLPIHDEPWIHATYPPVFPRLQAALGGSLQAGRMLALAATLVAAFAVGLLLVARGVPVRRAALWGVVFLGAPAVHEWGALCRVDTVALALSVLGLWLAERRGGELLAVPLFAGAFFTKQIVVAAPAAVFLSLWLAGERRRALMFATAYGTLVLLTFGFLDWRSAGEARLHLVGYTGSLGYSFGELAAWSLRFLFTFPVLLAFAVGGLPRLGQAPIRIYAVLALATIVLAGKPGAAANYLLEASAACVIVGAIAVERRLADLEFTPERRRDLVLLLVVQMLLLCGPGRILEVRSLWRENADAARAVAALAAAPGLVLSEDLGLALAAGKPPRLEPFQFAELAKRGIFDPAPVIAKLAHREFGAVLSGWRLREVPGIVAALEDDYHMRERIGPWELWVPKP